MSMTTAEFRTRVHNVIQDIIRKDVERIVFLTARLHYIGSYDDWDSVMSDLKYLASEFFSDAHRISAYAGNAQKIANRIERDEFRLSIPKSA